MELLKMSRRRVLARVSFGLFLMAVVGFAILYLIQPIRPTQERFEQVKKGMTQEQVVRIVGGLPGDYSNDESTWNPFSDRYQRYNMWLIRESQLMVRFDETGKVDDIIILQASTYISPPSLMARWRQRLGF
ncbi:outer membrane protein assembly factor BamE domain-containing protein [Limnoglobus roseus]|uniref:outer membrane protein assembly factor BamE domain-containing protein n=1 Tax=Limnoglobus roseus TaxID=2598579 RepID=UPI0011EB2AB6|nr:outer membrane protein assembly factor BamE [Limnoglobus roseus]